MARLFADQGEQDQAQFRAVEHPAAATAPAASAPAKTIAKAILERVGKASAKAAMATAHRVQAVAMAMLAMMFVKTEQYILQCQSVSNRSR